MTLYSFTPSYDVAIQLFLLFSVVLLLFIVQLLFFGMKTFWNVFGCDLFAISSDAAGVSSLTTCHVFLFIFISVISCHSNDNCSFVNRKWFWFHLELSFLSRANVLPFLYFVQLCHSVQTQQVDNNIWKNTTNYVGPKMRCHLLSFDLFICSEWNEMLMNNHLWVCVRLQFCIDRESIPFDGT